MYALVHTDKPLKAFERIFSDTRKDAFSLGVINPGRNHL
jgi:hypothetical protein